MGDDGIRTDHGIFADGDARGALVALRDSWQLWRELDVPYEAARARLMLAEAARSDDPEVAEAEARTALSAFDGLGAGRDADNAAALLRQLGVKAARAAPKNLGILTKRESEVLKLLGGFYLSLINGSVTASASGTASRNAAASSSSSGGSEGAVMREFASEAGGDSSIVAPRSWPTPPLLGP